MVHYTRIKETGVGAWRSLVAHLLWEQGAGGSNPSAPTNVFNRLRPVVSAYRTPCPHGCPHRLGFTGRLAARGPPRRWAATPPRGAGRGRHLGGRSPLPACSRCGPREAGGGVDQKQGASGGRIALLTALLPPRKKSRRSGGPRRTRNAASKPLLRARRRRPSCIRGNFFPSVRLLRKSASRAG